MARRLAERGPRPDTIISSTARRAVDTARAFASELQLPRDALILHASIYGAGVPELVGLIRGIDEGIDDIMLVGHNPAFSELRRHLTSRSLEDLPTCAVVTLEGRVEDWQHTGEGTFRLVDTDLPKGRER